MALRLVNEHCGLLTTPTGNFEVSHRIEIHDRNAGGNEPFKIGKPGVTIRVEGEVDELQPVIQPCTCEFDMLVQNAAHEQFVQDLAQNDEYRFVVMVWRDGKKIFTGVIYSDQVVLEDSNRPYKKLRVRAIDGVVTLVGEPFNFLSNPNPTNTSGRATIEEIMAIIWDTHPCKDYYDGNFFALGTDLYADNMSGSGTSPWSELYLDRRSLFKDDNLTEYYNCYEILEWIIENFDLRLIYAQNKYWAESLLWRYDYPGDVYNYDFTFSGASYTTKLNSLYEDINTAQSYRKFEGIFYSKSRIESLILEYNHGVGSDYLLNREFDFSHPGSETLTDIGLMLVPDGIDLRIKVIGNIRFYFNAFAGYDINDFFKVYFQIALNLGAPADDYLDRQLDLTQPDAPYRFHGYDTLQWTSSAADEWWLNYPYYVGIEENLGEDKEAFLPFTLITPVIDNTVNLVPIDAMSLSASVYDSSGASTGTSTPMEVKLNDAKLFLIDPNENQIHAEKTTVYYYSGANNSKELKREIRWSDLTNNAGVERAFMVSTDGGSTFEPTTSWDTVNLGGRAFQEMIATQRAVRRNRAQWILSGTIDSINDLILRNLSYCGRQPLIFLRGQYSSHRCRWDAEWWEAKLSLGAGSTARKRGDRDTRVQELRENPSPGGTGYAVLTEEYLNGDMSGGGTQFTPGAQNGAVVLPDLTTLDDDQIRGMIQIVKNGVGQLRYGASSDDIDGWTINTSTTVVTLKEAILTGEWINVYYYI